MIGIYFDSDKSDFPLTCYDLNQIEDYVGFE